MTNEDLSWARDWAIVGGSTCYIAPATANAIIGIPGLDFVHLVALLGAGSGAVIGVLWHRLLRRFGERFWPAISLFAVLPLLGAWGGVTSAVAAWYTVPDLLWAAFPCGALVAWLLCGWLAPVYAWLSARRTWRMPLAVFGPPVVAAVGGVLCIPMVMVVLPLVS